MKNLYRKLGIHIPDILLPISGTDLTKWSVIACDQYTSQPDYWDSVEREAGQSPSTFKLIFPEIYLKDDDKEERISNINKNMEQYLSDGTLEPQKPGFILVERSTPHTSSRKGLVVALDLECYDYSPGAQTLIRATEGTVLDRIPPRVKIRENASIELPHIMVLIDDPDRAVIENLYTNADAGRYNKLYDFELMQGGGHIKGWKIDDEDSLSMVAQALKKLEQRGAGYECCDLLFAVGDGNHSLATAKAHWENVKSKLIKSQPSDGIPEHPARYALVELVNVHDDGLIFEPIHRMLFNIDPLTILEKLKNACKDQLCADYRMFSSKDELNNALASQVSPSGSGSNTTEYIENNTSGSKRVQLLPFILEGRYGILTIENPTSNIEVGTLQAILDELLKSDPGIEIDYIHGDEVVTELGSKAGSIGFYLPVMNKHDLFPTIKNDGVLPRKTFSMGEAEEKRYYLECRRIK